MGPSADFERLYHRQKQSFKQKAGETDSRCIQFVPDVSGEADHASAKTVVGMAKPQAIRSTMIKFHTSIRE
jgi:hypothetical protein